MDSVLQQHGSSGNASSAFLTISSGTKPSFYITLLAARPEGFWRPNLRHLFPAALALLVTVATAQNAPYCRPIVTNVGCGDEYIQQVAISNVIRVTNCVGSPAPLPGYANYTETTEPIHLTPGQTYNIGVTVANFRTGDRVYLFLDVNRNFVFAPSELLAVLTTAATGNGTQSRILTGSVTIPTNATNAGWFRVRLSRGPLPGGAESCFSPAPYGETEDYASLASNIPNPPSPTRTMGVKISEIVYGPIGGPGLPTYVEIVNTETAAQSTANCLPLAGTVFTSTPMASNLPTRTFTVPLNSTAMIYPVPKPGTPVFGPSVALLANGPFPPGSVPPNVPIFIDPLFFQGGPGQTLGQPGLGFGLCITSPQPLINDRAEGFGSTSSSSGPPITICGTSPFYLSGELVNESGLITRWTYVDSDTDVDFETTYAPSPGFVNPKMVHVNGFLLGNSGNPTQPIPLTVSGSEQGVLTGAAGVVRGIQFLVPDSTTDTGFVERNVLNPAFDSIIGGSVSFASGFTADPVTPPTSPWLPSLTVYGAATASTTNNVITVTSGGSSSTPGTVTIPFSVGTVVRTTVRPDPARPGNFQVERLITDLVSDAPPGYEGQLTSAQKDTQPDSTGTSDVWCEAILYDHNGNAIRALAKNWPPAPSSGAQTVVGRAADGTAMMVNSNFPANTQVYNVFSFSPPLPGASQPFVPDAITSMVLAIPYPPFLVTTDANGNWVGEIQNMPSAPGQPLYFMSIYLSGGVVQTTLIGQTIF